MDYTAGTSYVSAISSAAAAAAAAAAGLVQHFNSGQSACHFSGEQQEQVSPTEQPCQSAPLHHHPHHLLSLHHHHHQSSYSDDLISPPSPSPSSTSSALHPSSSSLTASSSLQHLYGSHHQVRYSNTPSASLGILSHSIGGTTTSSTSSNSNSLTTAAVSLFGSGFHGNGFPSSLSPPSTMASRTPVSSASANYSGGGSSFFPPPNGIHFQGKKINNFVSQSV